MKKYITQIEDGAFMNYTVYTPETMRDGLPMILYLHGAGERGTAVDHLTRYAIPMLIEEMGREYEAVILCPQCPGNCVWDNIPFEVKAIVDRVAAEYKVDPTRISATGSSMGGFGTWTMGLTFTGFFSAIAPVAGGGMSWRCANLRTTPVRAYHGGKDGTVPVIYSEMMVNAVNKLGGSATLTILDGYGHNDGIDAVYRDTDVIDWLITMTRTDFTPVPETLSNKF